MNKVYNVYNDILNQLDDNDVVVAGISGGPDSMCLLNLLIRVRNKKNITIICAHVHHNVRKESDDELIFVKNYCENNNVIFESMKIEQKINGNFECEARKIRYDFFEKLILKYNGNYLMTAHHGDDLMETILMRIVRGSNLKGYIGFSEINTFNKYVLFRPLIKVTKAEIIEYNKNNNIPWVEDYTNMEDEHTRNRYRKYVLPKLKEEDKNVNEKFLKFSNTLLECCNYVDKTVNLLLSKIYIDNKININLFLKQDIFIQKQIIYSILYDFYKNNIYLINDKHVDLILNMIQSEKSNKEISLPENVVAAKNYDEFFLCKKQEILSYSYVLNNSVLLPNNKSIILTSNCDWTSNFVCRLSSDEIKLPLIIRTRQEGDKIYVKNMGGSKKVKDIFIDEKIKQNDRNTWPIVVDSNNKIVWIPGVKKSKYDKQYNEKYDIILKYQ